MRIACLHTANSNIAVFDTAARALGLAADVLLHEVRADLLAAAENAGGLTPEIALETTQTTRGLAPRADAVLLTCSTLGPAVDGLTEETGVPVLRVDAALAQEALAGRGKVTVLCAVETTMGPTQRLFKELSGPDSASFEIRLVPGAWALFRAGDVDGYLGAVALAADRALEGGADRVALAQASMAAAASLTARKPEPLASPKAGLAAAIRQATTARASAISAS